MSTLAVNNAQIHYRPLYGDPSRPVLVFLHEGLGSIEMWKEFPEKLCRATGCSGLVFDREGYGGSSALTDIRDDDYLHEYAYQELPEVLAELIPDKPYILIGHSDGGSIALLHAAQRPEYLKGVITEAAHIFVEDVTLEGIRVATDAYAAGKLAGLNKYHGDKTDQIFRAWSDTWLKPSFAKWNIEQDLSKIDVKTLAIQGADDQYATDHHVLAIQSGIGPHAEAVILPNCAHTPHREQPDATLALMQQFIAEIVGIRTAPSHDVAEVC